MRQLRHFLNDRGWLTTRRATLIAIWIFLACLTHIPVPATVQRIQVSDKLVHLLAYFPLGLLLPTCHIQVLNREWKCFAVIALYGVLDELLQIPVGRIASFYDWLADLLGASFGAITAWNLTVRATPPD